MCLVLHVETHVMSTEVYPKKKEKKACKSQTVLSTFMAKVEENIFLAAWK